MTYLNTASVDQVLQTKRQASAKQDGLQQVAFSQVFTADYQSPVLVISEQRLRQNAQRFMAAMPRVRPHFAVKANPDKQVLNIFKQEGVYFEIASMDELDLMIALEADLETVFYSNPIKSSASIKHAANHSVRWFSVDTPEEVEKIAGIKPDAKLYLRIEVSNEGSSWPLADKFGASSKGVTAIIETAKQLNMQLNGVTFHVGSQCTNIDNWIQGIDAAKALFATLEEQGFKPELLNLGGGYPVQYTGLEANIEEIGTAINEALKTIPDTIQVMAEPGRYLVASAGCLVTQVVGVATRDKSRWLYLDTGVYGGLMELAQEFPAKLLSERSGQLESWTLAGPTCDSIDVMGTHLLPTDLTADDFIYAANLGAYCTTCACEFNGFPAPELKMVR